MKKYLKKITPLYDLYLYLFRLKNAIYQKITIPGYETKRKAIITEANKYKCREVFIETGTFMGDTIAYLKDDFDRLISIELNKELAEKCKARFVNEKKIEILQGDSAQLLAGIITSINTPIVFWLDGHYSSEFWAGENYIITSKAQKETPILEELKQIVSHPVKNHVILIDDARLFNGKDDYPEISHLKQFVKTSFPYHSLSVKRDMIRILPRT